jgi:hypothetical protein
MTVEYPTYGYVRIADQRRLIGVPVSAAAVRGCGGTRAAQTLRIACCGWSLGRLRIGGLLTDRVKRLLARYQRPVVVPKQRVGAPYQSFLGYQDTYYEGTPKGPGRVYAQTFVDSQLLLAGGQAVPVEDPDDRGRPVSSPVTETPEGGTPGCWLPSAET